MSTANSSPEVLLERVRRALETFPRPPAGHLVALSGGLDSTVLLHLMARLRGVHSLPLRAVHVEHGLHGDAKLWTEHCRKLCAALSVPFHALKVEVARKPGESLEAVARDARYAALAALLQPGEMLLLAHHADDQAETFMLQALRGAGVAGLAAMPAARRWKGGWMARPLLGIARRELHHWAETSGLEWVEDPSNRDLSFSRNYLRHEIMPRLARRWPEMAATIGRSARHCAESAALLEELAALDLEQAVGGAGWQLDLSVVGSLSPARQRNLLRYWIRLQNVVVPGSRVLARIPDEVVAAREDAQPEVCWDGGAVRRFRTWLYLFPEPLPQPPREVRLWWDGEGPLELPGGLGSLEWEAGRPAWFPGSGVTVTFRSDGLKCRPAGRSGSRSFKRLCQDLGIPPWLRPLLPLVELDGRLAAIAGFCLCEPFSGRPGLRWNRAPWLG